MHDEHETCMCLGAQSLAGAAGLGHRLGCWCLSHEDVTHTVVPVAPRHVDANASHYHHRSCASSSRSSNRHGKRRERGGCRGRDERKKKRWSRGVWFGTAGEEKRRKKITKKCRSYIFFSPTYMWAPVNSEIWFLLINWRNLAPDAGLHRFSISGEGPIAQNSIAIGWYRRRLKLLHRLASRSAH
uniref:Uncharacterized protein n=1 Tax=Oryza sativa subsp. japonica TaxID=39947 RepID=Q5W6H9_ORYSJ|nr:hypothetical protein [Oryza sativa Japonica Group]